MTEQRLPVVDGDDGSWGDILNQFLSKEHVNTGSDNASNGGHKTITLQAGTTSAGTAPIKLTSGSLLTTPETGAIEFFGDKYYMTITNGTARKRVALLDDGAGATGDTYYRDSGGNFQRLAASTDNKVLTLTGGLPVWADTQLPSGGATTSTAQTLTNKTLDTTNTITVKDTNFTIQDDATPSKQLQFELNGLVGTRTLTAPNANTTIVGTDASQALTNKDLTGTGNTFPTFNQSTTGSAATLTTPRTVQTNLASTSSASFNGSANITPGVTGTLAVGNGGTGATSLTGLVKGNGTSAMTAATAGTDYTTPTGAESLTNKTITYPGVAAPSYTQGKLVYDTDNESLTFYNNDSNVSLQVGQEEWVRVRNTTGSTIANGVAVYFNGTNAGLPTIALAQANATATTVVMGLTTESIANNAIGYITSIGVVHGLNTSGFTAGSAVYLSETTAGNLTQTAPSAPNYRYRVGMVTVSDASVGAIHVTPSTAALGNGTANQIFGINNAGTAQEVKSITADTGASVVVTHSANAIKLSRAALTGDVTATADSNVTTLAVVGTAGTKGSASSVPVFVTDTKGRVTSNTDTPIVIAESQVTNLTTDLSNKQVAFTPTSVKTSAYTAAPGQLVPVDVSSGTFSITMPTAPADKTAILVKKNDTSANIVTLQAGGTDVFNKVGGATSLTLDLPNQLAAVQYDASTGVWYLIGSNIPLAQLTTMYQTKTTLTAKGDMYVATGSGVVTNQPIGGNDTLLIADSSQANGLKWSNTLNAANLTAPNITAGTANAGSTMAFAAGTLMTTPEAGAVEYDGTNKYSTIDTTSGRGSIAVEQKFRLAANGTAITTTIADFYGSNSAFPYVASGVYEITWHVLYSKATAGTVTYTITSSTAPTMLSAWYTQSAAAGIATAAAALRAGIVNSTATAAALPVTSSLTTTTNHIAEIKTIYEAGGTAGNVRLRATCSAGSLTPLRGSYYTVRRLPSGNVGSFVA